MSKDVQAEPQYDVAISFLNEHLALAEEIRDELADRLTTFVYSKEQSELVGRAKDGVEGFTDVFRRNSRVCVVLYSEGWGKKGMTFVEEAAMKERALSPGQGWDFLIVVSLDRTAPPDWIPKLKIWWGYKEYGLPGLLAAIDIKVTELGGRPKQDSVVEKAKRLQRQRDFAQRKHDFTISGGGFKVAQEEITRLYVILKTRIQELSEVYPDLGLSFEENTIHYRSAAAISQRASLVMYWQPEYANIVGNGGLLVKEWGGHFSYSGWFGGPPELGAWSVTPTINYADQVVWEVEDGKEPLTSEKLVDFFLERLLSHAHEARDTGVPFLRRRRDEFDEEIMNLNLGFESE